MKVETVMKKITAGDVIGQFLVTEVLEPFKNGNALIKARYQGSYINGYLSVVDSRQYGNQEINGDKLLGNIREYNNTFRVSAKGETTPDHQENKVWLPDHISSTLSPDGTRLILGYFSTNNWCNTIVPHPLSSSDLKSIAKALDTWHKKGVGHGMLHPNGVWKNDGDPHLNFICPIFPVMVLDSGSPWVYDSGEKNIEKDRKAFCQLMLDSLNGESDNHGFLDRLAHLETTLSTQPFFKSYLLNKNISCEQFLNSSLQEKEADDRRKQSLTAKKRRQKSIFKLFIAAAVFLILAGCYFFLQEKWEREERRLAIQKTIEEIHKTKENKRWQDCIKKADEFLQLHPNNKEVLLIKNEALSMDKVARLISLAIRATNELQWTECYQKANEALQIETNNIEALNLKSKAESNIKIISQNINDARQAQRNKDWQKSLNMTKRVLQLDPLHSEAEQLKKDAEKMIKMTEVVKKAQEAKKNKNWDECLTRANEALDIIDNDIEARSLRDTAAQKIKKASTVLNDAYEAARVENWRVCIEKAEEVLSIRPSEMAENLKKDAEKKLNIQKNLSDAVEAKRTRDWEICLAKVAKVLSIEPENQEATRLKSEAELAKKRMESLALARSAKYEKKWDLCLEMATIASEIEDELERSEALLLKSDAERNLRLQKVLITARMAKVAENWTECETKAEEVLREDPNHAEAKDLKSFSKRMQQPSILDLLALAREAKDKKDWETCLNKATEVSSLESNNKEAENLKKEASRQISIANLLEEARQLAIQEAWQLCSNKCAEILVLEPTHQEANELRKKAVNHLNPSVSIKFVYNNSHYTGKVWDGHNVFDTTKSINLRNGQKYIFFYWVQLSPNAIGQGKFAFGKTDFIFANWFGPTNYTIILKESDTASMADLAWALEIEGVPFNLR